MRLSILAALTLLLGLLSALAMQVPAHASVAVGDFVYTARTSDDTLIKLHTSSGVTTLADAGGNGPGAGGNGMASPAISPDGSKVAFSMYACDFPGSTDSCYTTLGESYVLVVVNSDGSGLQAITQGTPTQDIVDWQPTWSPDGSWIAFERVGGSSTGIYKIHPDGSGLAQMINDTGNVSSDYQGLVWSPDGTKFAYAHYNSTSGHMELRYSNTDGSGETVVPNQPNPSMDDNSMPAWAPNSSRLYFQNFHFGTATIQGIDLAGSNLVQETNGGSNEMPSVSADGSTLIVSAGATYSDLFTVPTNGSMTQTTVTSDGTTFIHEWPSFVKAAWPTSSAKTLVALGDSVAAGEGINYGWGWDNTNSDWVQTGVSGPSWTDTTTAMGSNYQICHQSDEAYDRILYNQNLKVFNMSCTGAQAMSGVLTGGSANGSSYPAELGGTCTGCSSVNTYYDSHNPDVVTLTLGADDVNFAHWVSTCYGGTSACNTSANTTTLNGQLSTEKSNLRLVLNELNRRAGLKGKTVEVIVTNYYNPFPSTYTSCIDTAAAPLSGTYPWIGITSGEQSWIVSGLNSLNSNISSEVTYAQGQGHDSHLTVKLADISGVMSGHTLCSSDPWVYGPSINYPPIGGGPLTNPAPMHPTPHGQNAIEQVVASKV